MLYVIRHSWNWLKYTLVGHMTDHVTIPAVDMDIRAELVRLVSDCQCDRYWPWHEGGEVPREAGRRERGPMAS